MGGLPPIPPGDDFGSVNGWTSFGPPLLPQDGPWDPLGPPWPPPGTPEGPLGPIWLPPWIPLIRPCWVAPFGPFWTISPKSHNGENSIKDNGFLMVLGAPQLSKWAP